MFKKIAPYTYHIILILTTMAMILSLYFSEILGFAPCELCWYQRIALYPLVPIAIIAIRKKDIQAWQYMLPLGVFGWLISLYQNLLYFNIISEGIKPCTGGVSCTAEYVHVLGFLDIPQMSFLTLSVVLMVLWAHYTYVSKANI